MCLLEVTSFLGEGIHAIRGKARSLDNICNSVFVNMRLAAKFGLIKPESESHAMFPCLLLFAQDLFLACCLSLSVLELWIAESLECVRECVWDVSYIAVSHCLCLLLAVVEGEYICCK